MYNIDTEDRDTILAALRYYQRDLAAGHPAINSDEIADIASNGGAHAAMDEHGIDDLCERINTAETPIFAIILESGLVQSIVSNVPEAYSGHRLMVIDYDIEGSAPGDRTGVPQDDGSTADAICHAEDVDRATIDLGAVLRQMEA